MAIRVVKNDFLGSKGHVTFASDRPVLAEQIEELQGPAVKSAAIIEAAKHGISKPSLTDVHQAPYPVQASGEPLENPLTQQVAYYLVDIRVVSGL